MYRVLNIISILMVLVTHISQVAVNNVSVKVDDIQRSLQISRTVFEIMSTLRPVEITISAAGDCTIGYDIDFGYEGSYNDIVSKNGYEYPLKNVVDIFNNDDITVANLETTLTNATGRADKEFKFKGEPEYIKILQLGSVEAVNIANNHIYDYLEKGYTDTLNVLKIADIGFFGEDYRYVKSVKGIKVGFLGYTGWTSNRSIKNKISSDIQDLKKDCNAVVVSFHWGIERENYPNWTQKDLGRHSIDSGADLVLGHHPHVIQGIETYKGKNIVYSMGNFTYGGHKNPNDKDTFIFSQKFRLSGKKVYPIESKVIPCSISSAKNYNNYQPTPLAGDDGERIIKRLREYSAPLEYGYNFDNSIVQ